MTSAKNEGLVIGLAALLAIGEVTGATAQPTSAVSNEISTTEMQKGRWVPRGTFALSNLEPNPEREKSYARSKEERARILTFLPSMTTVYQTSPASLDNYYTSVTQAGLNVQVLGSELSTGRFNDLDAKDVVFHRPARGCRNAACSGDDFLIGLGTSFRISEEDDEEIVLMDGAERQAVYSVERFAQDERRGMLTRHKDRENPRWSIYDGYVSEFSTGCGERREKGASLSVPKSDYEREPSSWSANDPNWSLKALEVMGLGNLSLDESEQTYVGRLSHDIAPSSEGIDGFEDAEGPFAIDMTVIAYQDSTWDDDYFKFAGIVQVVQCASGRIGGYRPTFVISADIFFDRAEGDDYDQVFPLDWTLLQRVYSQEDHKALFGYTRRSSLFSINSSEEYERVFDLLSETIPYPSAIANFIARLNASCGSGDRAACREISSRFSAME